MPDTHRRPRAVRTSAGGGAAAAGEVVEVQGGGHIVRATGRKDRHSKVCTAKGLRDRRVRLSAHTAIQFYDVQDRLGLDRPSKAVDWLIKNAKPSIDQLAQLPPWRPPPPSPPPAGAPKRHLSNDADDYSASPYGYCAGGSSSLLPPSLVTDQIADTIKSFFPMPPAAAASSGYASGVGLLPHAAGGSGRHAEDLRLSLQSFQDPIFNHQQSRAGPMAFQDPIFNLAETAAGDAAAGGGSGRYLFGLSSQLVQNQFFTQWGTLQSSHPPSIRAMENPNALSGHQTHLTSFRRSSTPPVPAYRNAAGEIGGVGFSGYHFPARIQGGEEHDGPPPSAPRH